MEERARTEKFPIIGPACGHFCYQIARMIGARQVCELGSGFGYSTAWFARAVRENGGGAVQHIVWDEELSRQARAQLEALGYGDTIAYHVGEAVAVLRGLPGPFDLVFNDIDKEGYPVALPVVAERLRPGGVLIIDNALWGGRIFDATDLSPATQGVREVTRLLAEDPGWILSTVPIRDGMLVAFRAGGAAGAGGSGQEAAR
jgi:predicted O-methyltransferase YrrM